MVARIRTMAKEGDTKCQKGDVLSVVDGVFTFNGKVVKPTRYYTAKEGVMIMKHNNKYYFL